MKSLANPARIFYVPYSLAVMNFAILFSIFLIGMLAELAVTQTLDLVIFNPLYFMIVLIGAHMILMSFSKQEPQLAQIIAAKMQLFRLRAPAQMEP